MNKEQILQVVERLSIDISMHYDEHGCTPLEFITFANEIERVVKENCAQIARQTLCDTHIPTGIKIYGGRAAKAIMAQ